MNTKSFDEVLAKFQAIQFDESFDMIVAIANGGIIPAAIINQRLNVELNLLKINLRDPFQKPKFDTPQLLEPINFDFKNKTILLVEVNLAVSLLKDAAVVKTFAVNGNADYELYNESCFRFPWIV